MQNERESDRREEVIRAISPSICSKAFNETPIATSIKNHRSYYSIYCVYPESKKVINILTETLNQLTGKEINSGKP
jgi:hypothetical protein